MLGLRYSWDHTVMRARNSPVPLTYREPALPTGPLAHRNTLPREAFDLPADRFGVDSNLIDCLASALDRLTGQPEHVISPVGSIVYARRDGDLLWDLVHDADVWCYVPGWALAGRSLQQWHVALQVELHRELVARGVRTRLTWRNRYVNLVDLDGRLRMIELKIAQQEWLTEGLARIHHRFCGVRARRGWAYSLRPRLEWAAYSAFENHYPSPAAEQSFADTIASLDPRDVMRGLRFVYHENLASALRRFGPAHVMESQVNRRRAVRNRRGVLKKLLMLSVMRRDEDLRRRVLQQLQALAGGAPLELRGTVQESLADLTAMSDVDAVALSGWLHPASVDVRRPGPSALQPDHLSESPGGREQLVGSALLDDPTR